MSPGASSTWGGFVSDRESLGAPIYEEEPCFDCGGSGYDSPLHVDCETCAGTGLIYTQLAIALQVALEEEHRV
jgi:DnaJ-class molecular chaperone